MRRTSTLAVDTRVSNDIHDDLHYDLDLSPRTSIYSAATKSVTSLKAQPEAPLPPQPAAPVSQPPAPSIRLLFSLLSRRHLLCLLLPAVCSSVVAGGVAPFMTYVIGQAFDAFALFPLGPNPPQVAKDALLQSVGLVAIELLGLAVGSLALGSVTSSLWIWTGERNAMALRKAVYRSVAKKDMVWFDTNLGEQEAGGLMARFTRETDDVRMATSLASGYLVQYLTTTLTCLLLAFIRSWALTLVILSAVPLLTLIQSFSQSIASPLLFQERAQTTSTATLVDRALSAIPTVKAFNAQLSELTRASGAFEGLRMAAKKLNKVWGITSALAQFVMMGMFVQGFWFGSKLVREGKVSAGDVMATFWACLIATSNLQMCIPQFITLAKGKFAMAALMETIHDSPSPSTSTSTSTSTIPTTPLPDTYTTSPTRTSMHSTSKPPRRSQTLKKITPQKCHGEFALHDVTFSYPSKPSTTVLSNVSLYLPANETTFIVGSSGSGKSTIAALLMRMYDPSSGTVMLDDQDVRFLDESWVRGHVAAVSQGFGGVVVLDGKTLWENIAVGICGRPSSMVTMLNDGEVEEACRMAMVHEFVKDLPEGYQTVLGSSSAAQGVALSGGQRQRLALARARVRDPTVLILDEATSALDATSRILVFEAIKQWRKNKTTIVITHDLSQIQAQDFIYVLKNGRVVEQGYRADLERVPPSASSSSSSASEIEEDDGEGEFRKMMESQRAMGGFPEKDIDTTDQITHDDHLEALNDEEDQQISQQTLGRRLSVSTIRPLTFGNWMFDVVADLTSQYSTAAPTTTMPKDAVSAIRASRSLSRFIPFPSPITEETDEEAAEAQYAHRPRRPSSVLITPTTPTPVARVVSRRWSLQFTPTSPTSTLFSQSWTQANAKDVKEMQEAGEDEDEEEKQFGEQKDAVRGAGRVAAASREKRQRRGPEVVTVRVPSPLQEEGKDVAEEEEEEQPPKFFQLLRKAWPTIPQKPLLFFGLLVCLASGGVTPIFSFLLSRLLFEVSIGAHNVSTINVFGGIVLSIAALDGILLGAKYYIMESVGMKWVTNLRNDGYSKVLKQDKAWFDDAKHTPARLIQVIVKDGDDARNLISVVIAQCLVVFAMLSIGLLWAMIRGWELTLVGLGIAPVFAGVMALQTQLVGKCEVRNKRAREEVARGWYDVLCNIKGIRSMGIAQPFLDTFDDAVEKALDTGVRGAWVEGGTHGVASGLIYVAEAVLFYVGAVLVAKGRYSYLQMVEVLNLVVFSVTIGSQLMAFTEKIAKSAQATQDLMTLTDLETNNTSESKGLLRPSPSLLSSGPVAFENVSFAYPSRPSVLTLKNFNLRIDQGECIALVGSSGSGKSTVASLLQRFYEPLEGRIRFGDVDVNEVDVQHLRNGLGVVSQSPQLFEDASLEANILYGIPATAFVSEEEREAVVCYAAKLANVDWLDGVEGAFKAPLGEVSGGQAQRIQIARALARSGVHLLILDECTSALDVENQRQVMEAIKNVRRGEHRGRLRMVVVTHKVEVMRMCDRVVVMKDGEVCEEGAYEELVEKKGGVFRDLARGGVWEA
ncbi:P-loop containing nucleoside triphosphate hydrolase protein [Macrolepiota fuliginosa MF-IS2]|uniref:P-loop containing nucleoside triphosphate hydrolase protein n=1 Tax=Macrolepiota fuliginosa MF-IS2 TaxID=1400762 RepID=A0A9P5XDT1_9AGAR|nr:P-loop containing nucleoside triphosphate hydrolase protein [Macrolepiota fuliginosa MF-IS2]